MAVARFDDFVTGRALVCPPPRRVLTTDDVDEVHSVLREVELATAAGEWAFGYVSYEAAPGLPAAARSAADPPLIWFGLCDEPVEDLPVSPPEARRPSRWTPGWRAAEHARAVAAVRRHIAAGETYQCNLTDRLRAAVDDPYDLYRRLATSQRAAYNAYVDLGRFVIASASPELFFDWTGDRLRTRPMKGTARRDRDPAVDAELARGLRASAKEQAENLMIVDLLRNDLSRVAALGTVEVTELFAVERYPTVWQLASEIAARPRPECGLADIFAALFPCGSVTGAPKHRSMEIIRDLEEGPRGVYCGAVGLVAPPGAPFRARFNVAIRTAVLDRSTGIAVYGAGGGITWDSDAAAEHAELLTKAAVLSHDPTRTLMEAR
ncbi:aminodeoxychorismate synthase component I [Paractinoplanes globisporus]|uniref:Aminodeoxychorismate synthase component I n=1 Tax=Paractinoplanes globisporus TaxID=113565 RepID=A0ABW6W884_9ACTN|nr:aminodeoxychorismate synthase component I [Actinoplanes globisporus]